MGHTKMSNTYFLKIMLRCVYLCVIYQYALKNKEDDDHSEIEYFKWRGNSTRTNKKKT